MNENPIRFLIGDFCRQILYLKIPHSSPIGWSRPLRRTVCRSTVIADTIYLAISHFCFAVFIPRHFKKCRVLCYTLRSKIFVQVSFPLSVCPSVSASFQLSARCIFQPIFFKLGIRVDIGKECLVIADG